MSGSRIGPSGLSFVVTLALALAWLGSVTASAQATEQDPGAEALHLRRGEIPRADDFETARTIGAGLGLRAGAYGATAAITNPANLPLGRVYHMEAFTQYTPREGGVSFGSVIVDSSTNRIRAGVASRAIFGDGEHDYRGSESRLALGTALSDAIGIGLSARYLRLVTRDRTSDGYALSPELRVLTMDASLRVTPFEGFFVAAYGYNLIRTHSVIAPTQIGGGLAYQYKTKFQVGFDLLVDLTTFSAPRPLYGGGIEWWPSDHYPIRAGYRRDEGRKIHTLTMSVGYNDTRYAVELALRQELGEFRQSTLLVSARYAIDVQPSQ